MKLLNLSSMYQGSLDSFYQNNPSVNNLGYEDHYNLLLKDTTEFAGSYTRNFLKLGVDARCIVSNDIILQEKWKLENKLVTDNIPDLLFEQIKSFQPEILWLENLTYLEDDWFTRIRSQIHSVKLIIAYHCAPYTQQYLNKLRNADFIITCTPGLKETMEKEGMKAYLVYHGFDSQLLARLGKDNSQSSVALTFSGSLITGDTFHNERIKLIEKLIDERIDITLFVTLERSYRIRAKQAIFFLSELLKKAGLGKLTQKQSFFEYGRILVKHYSRRLIDMNHPPQYGIKMYDLLSQSKIVLNIHTGVAGNYAGNMRMFEVTGVGSCLLTDNKNNMQDLFDIGTEVMVYNNTDDCINKVRWLLEHEEEREKIAKAGQKKTLEMHTVESRCRRIIEIITEEMRGREGEGEKGRRGEGEKGRRGETKGLRDKKPAPSNQHLAPRPSNQQPATSNHHMDKNTIKDLLPPALLRFLTGLFYGWHGNYPSWNEALKKCEGYGSENILEKVKKSAFKVKTGQAVYERDSLILDHIEYSFPLLSGLMYIAGQNNNRLNILDFGGSLGSSYYQNRYFLDGLSEVNWCVVEQPEYVKTGSEMFEDNRLHFFNTVEDCLEKYDIQVVLFSSVLQYLENPYGMLDKVLSKKPEYIIVDRTPFIDSDDRLTVQKVNPKIYKGSYPCWFFNEKKFVSYLTSDYIRVLEFDALDRANIKSRFKGFLFRKSKG